MEITIFDIINTIKKVNLKEEEALSLLFSNLSNNLIKEFIILNVYLLILETLKKANLLGD